MPKKGVSINLSICININSMHWMKEDNILFYHPVANSMKSLLRQPFFTLIDYGHLHN